MAGKRRIRTGFVWTRFGWKKTRPKAIIRAHNRVVANRAAAKQAIIEIKPEAAPEPILKPPAPRAGRRPAGFYERLATTLPDMIQNASTDE